MLLGILSIIALPLFICFYKFLFYFCLCCYLPSWWINILISLQPEMPRGSGLTPALQCFVQLIFHPTWFDIRKTESLENRFLDEITTKFRERAERREWLRMWKGWPLPHPPATATATDPNPDTSRNTATTTTLPRTRPLYYRIIRLGHSTFLRFDYSTIRRYNNCTEVEWWYRSNCRTGGQHTTSYTTFRQMGHYLSTFRRSHHTYTAIVPFDYSTILLLNHCPIHE